MFIFKRIIAALKYSEAIRKADKAHAQTGMRYYVLPLSGKGKKLIIMDRKNFRILKHKHYINHNTYIADLERECFYCTPYKNGSGTLPEEAKVLKQKEYLQWYDSKKDKKGVS